LVGQGIYLPTGRAILLKMKRLPPIADLVRLAEGCRASAEGYSRRAEQADDPITENVYRTVAETYRTIAQSYDQFLDHRFGPPLFAGRAQPDQEFRKHEDNRPTSSAPHTGITEQDANPIRRAERYRALADVYARACESEADSTLKGLYHRLAEGYYTLAASYGSEAQTGRLRLKENH
jgi:hypothetical protein